MKEFKLLKTSILIVLSLFIASCQSAPTLIISSSVPAKIERDGVQICSSTTCRIGGRYISDGFGSCVSGDNTRIEAFPLDPKSGFKQSKIVFASCGQAVNVFFDMSSGELINTIEHNSKSSQSYKNSTSDNLSLLKGLRDKGLITHKDYESKKSEILKNIK